MNDDSDRTKVTGKALRVNDNSAGERDQSSLPTKPRSSEKSRKVEGNALRVNDNSVEGEEPATTRKASDMPAVAVKR